MFLFEIMTVLVHVSTILVVGALPFIAAILTEIDIGRSGPQVDGHSQMSSAMLLAPVWGRNGEKIWLSSMLPEAFSGSTVPFRFHPLHQMIMCFVLAWYVVAFIELTIYYWNWAPHMLNKQFRVERKFVMGWPRFMMSSLFFLALRIVAVSPGSRDGFRSCF